MLKTIDEVHALIQAGDTNAAFKALVDIVGSLMPAPAPVEAPVPAEPVAETKEGDAA